MDWNNKQPIYLQLGQQVATAILDGSLAEGEAIPSIRQISSEYAINPVTVSKAIQGLVDQGLLEKRRGVGMYVVAGARQCLLEKERERFLSEEWPEIKQRMSRLGISLSELIP